MCNAKMIPTEITPGIKVRGWGRGRVRRMVEEVNSCVIHLTHCKYLFKCHNVPPASTIIKRKTKRKIGK
jgi:hypothetical protein